MSHVHIVLEEVAELKRSMAENTGLKELREQFARLTSSVKGKTLKITPDVLGLPVKPVCGNCSKNAGGLNDHACHMSIVWSTVYNPTLTRTMSSDANGIAREDRSGPYEPSQNLIIINLSPGDKVIVQTATFMCTKQLIHKGCPPADLHCGKYYNDVKNFVQQAFDRLCSEVSQSLEPHSGVNMDEYMVKYTEWVKGGFRHAANDGASRAISHNHTPREYPAEPPKIPLYSSMPQLISEKQDFRLINKSNNEFLIGGVCSPRTQVGVVPKNSDIWTLEPAN